MRPPRPRPEAEAEELRRLVLHGGPGGEDAFRTLAQARHRPAARALATLLASPDAPEEIRAASAVALGRAPPGSADDALMQALRSPPPVLRRAAEALGRIGPPEALPALAQTPLPAEPAAARALLFARRLLAHRHGLPPPDDPAADAPLAPFRAALAQSLEPRPAEPNPADLDALAAELPAVPLLPGAVSLSCGANRFLLLATAQAPVAARGPTLPAIVVKRVQATGHHAAFLYVLARPAPDGTLRLDGYRPDGTPALRGTAWPSAGTSRFRVEALDGVYLPPLLVEGLLDPRGSRLMLETAAVGPVARAGTPRARVPQPAR